MNKQQQLDIILKHNPMKDDYHKGIRSIDDIHTYEEVVDNEDAYGWPDWTQEDAMEALRNGVITIYSSKPIKNGIFVTPAYSQANEYAGNQWWGDKMTTIKKSNNMVYQKTVPLTDVAWIDASEGQYAKTDNKKLFLTEEQIHLLTESSRDNLLLPYLNILQQKGNNISLGQFKSYLLNKFVTEGNIHNLSLGSNFYLAGVARYYFNGDLTTNKNLSVFFPNVTDNFIPEVCGTLDKIILYLRNLHIDSVGNNFEQPEDFGELSIAKLFKKYGSKAIPKKNTEVQEYTSKLGNKINKKWSFEIMYSYDDCTKFNTATSPGAWCITYGEQHYKYYCKHYGAHFVIFYRNDFNNVERKVGPNYPLDEYGLSMIAVMQNNGDGRFINGTSRWNHGTNTTPHINNEGFVVSYEDLKKVTGISDDMFQQIFEEWKSVLENKKQIGQSAGALKREENLKVLRQFKYAQMLLNNGAAPETIFKSAYIKDNIVRENPKFNKCVLSVKKDIDDKHYWAICDKGNIIFDSIEDSYSCPMEHFSRYYGVNRDDINGINIIAIYLDSHTYKFYDYRTHKILNVDGNKKFKRCNKLLVDGPILFDLCKSKNTNYCYDYNTGMFLTFPNGEHAYENATCHNDLIHFNMDSMARTTYIYNSNTKSFVEELTNYYICNVYGNYITVSCDRYNQKRSLFDLDSNKFILENIGDIQLLSQNYAIVNRQLVNIDKREKILIDGKYPEIAHAFKVECNKKINNDVKYGKWVNLFGDRKCYYLNVVQKGTYNSLYHLIFDADNNIFLRNTTNGIKFYPNTTNRYINGGRVTYCSDGEHYAEIPLDFNQIVDFNNGDTKKNLVHKTVDNLFNVNESINEDSEYDETLLSEDNKIEDVMDSFEPMTNLNPKIWEDGNLNKRVRLKLLDIAQDFIESLNVDWVKPKDIILTGSIVNYNWSKYSDFDLHILMDFSKVDKKVDFVKEYFDSKKTIWNNTHDELKIYGYPVEVYVQDINEKHTASGIYSLYKDKWIKEPVKDKFQSAKLDIETIKNKTLKFADLIDKLEDEVNVRDIHKNEVLLNKIKNTFKRIKGIRKEALSNGDEMSIGNLVFKALRRLGYIERLISLRNLLYDKVNTIK